jgi:hypothetical protein
VEKIEITGRENNYDEPLKQEDEREVVKVSVFLQTTILFRLGDGWLFI